VNAQVNRDVEHLGALGVVHAEEENIAPPAVREVHAHRGAFAQDGVGAVARVGLAQFGPQAQGVVGGMAHAEHPLVAAHRTHAPADLVRQRLEPEPVVRRRQRAGDGIARAFRLLHGQKLVQGLLEAALEQMLVAGEGDERAAAGGGGGGRQAFRQMEPVDRVKEEQRAHALVEVFAAPAEVVQPRALVQEVAGGQAGAGGGERLVAPGGVGRGDELDQVGHGHFISRRASNSTSPLNTSSRSCPASARASCAVSRP